MLGLFGHQIRLLTFKLDMLPYTDTKFTNTEMITIFEISFFS